MQAARLTRRGMLQGVGAGALGLAGAALLGCGSTKEQASSTSVADPDATSVAGSTRGQGLPMVAPKVQGKIREGGTWTAAITSTYKQHDPHTALATNVWHIIGDKGLEPEPTTNKILPHVFTSWEVADPSGTTLVLKLNPKLFIHDKAPWNGRQFVAEDAAWNLERIGGLYADRLKIPLASFQRASMVLNISKATAVDPLTVKVSLSKPNSAFFNGLMENRVPFAPREMDDIGWKDPLKMAGTGPFVITEFINDQQQTYVKNPKYFRPGEPHFDKFSQIVIPDTAGAQAAFISGQTQLQAAPTPDVIDTLRKARPGSNLYTWVDQNWQHIRPNLRYEPFADYRVRRALFLAMDYKAMAEGYYGDGWAYQGALNPMFPEAWGPDKIKAQPGYNPETKDKDRADAAKLLDAAGFPNGKGLDFEIIFQNPSDVNKENATRSQSQLSATFTDMKMRLHPFSDSASFSRPQAEGNFQILAYTITCVPDAVLELISQYHSQGSRNYGAFKDPELDSLLDKAIGELKPEARTKMLDEAQQKFFDKWMPMYVLYAQPVKNMLHADIGGYDTTAGIAYGYGTNTKVNRWYYVDK